MTSIGTFPFGQPVREVVQEDRTPKRVFVLGVYSSAVHARWIGPDQKTKGTALAVASEPYIFWRGDNAESIIQQIAIPPKVGTLVPAQKQLNGPSGIALDDLILTPLGLTRAKAWLCDLVPHSCMNPSQEAAIKEHYVDVAQEYGLPAASVPCVPPELANDKRRDSILAEINESGASVVILLGDQPIRWYLSHYDRRWRSLRDFGADSQTYGRIHSAKIGGKEMQILPLAHPRQIAKLGRSSAVWYNLHQAWITGHANTILNS